MREIEFRAWVKETGKEVNNFMDNYILLALNSDQYIIEQYTGLKDKNGVKIFEGDLYTAGDENIKYKVIFKDCYFIGNQISNESLAGLNHFIKDIEVIGNIHQTEDK